MLVYFRVDASIAIGTGHVMRCLTLADALVAQGAECCFICREHPGNLIGQIRSKGYLVHSLSRFVLAYSNLLGDEQESAYASWLGTSQQQDAVESAAIIGEQGCDWLVVDHYALDAQWETELQNNCDRLVVIDDLADRPHQCDLLLDQTYGRNCKDYAPLVPRACKLLCGSQYALLRPEFSALRAYSLERRRNPQIRHLLISMGGVDSWNATGQILQALKAGELPEDFNLTVVMGDKAPWLAEVRQLAVQMPWPTQVLVGHSQMAKLMADSDLAIGAAGATSWERCCLGLPTILLVLADNQRKVANGLVIAGAVQLIDKPHDLTERLYSILRELLLFPSILINMSQAAAKIADGRGALTVIHDLEC